MLTLPILNDARINWCIWLLSAMSLWLLSCLFFQNWREINKQWTYIIKSSRSYTSTYIKTLTLFHYFVCPAYLTLSRHSKNGRFLSESNPGAHMPRHVLDTARAAITYLYWPCISDVFGLRQTFAFPIQ